MKSLLQDIRYALRQMRKSPAFTLTVMVTLALGIGANAAVFTLFDQVLLRMLPVERPKELVRFEWNGAFSGSMSSFGGDSPDHFNYFSYPMYKDLRDQSQVFEGMLAADKTGVGLSWRNQAEGEDAEVVTGNYFQMLGLKPAAGRLLTPQDDTVKNSNPVLVLSYNYWKRRFAAASDIVGQTVLVNGHSFTVLGVAPENFDSAIGGYKPGVFIPMSMVEVAMPWMAPRDDLNNHQSVFLTIVARLKPGVSRSQAEASLGPLWHALRTNEFALYKSRTERFRRRFIDESKLKVLDDSKGFNPGRIGSGEAAGDLDEHGWVVGVSLRHQRGHTAAAARGGAGEGDVNALRAGCAAQPHHRAIAGGGGIAGAIGSNCRAGICAHGGHHAGSPYDQL